MGWDPTPADPTPPHILRCIVSLPKSRTSCSLFFLPRYGSAPPLQPLSSGCGARLRRAEGHNSSRKEPRKQLVLPFLLPFLSRVGCVHLSGRARVVPGFVFERGMHRSIETDIRIIYKRGSAGFGLCLLWIGSKHQRETRFNTLASVRPPRPSIPDRSKRCKNRDLADRNVPSFCGRVEGDRTRLGLAGSSAPNRHVNSLGPGGEGGGP